MNLKLNFLLKIRLIIRGLHSDFSIDQQAEVFNLPPAGYRKVIISTSIAESRFDLYKIH